MNQPQTSSSFSRYRHSPWPTNLNPPGIPFIIANEGAERFSFYGMRAILVIFMTQYLVNSSGQLDLMSEAQAKGWFHLFVSAVYFLPLFGAIISDGLLGKYRTIIILSLVYCAGHLVLAIDHTRVGLAIGLGLIALGSGGIKPCVSAHLGDQFGSGNQHLLARVFSWFYFAINLGAFFSILATPWLMNTYGPSVAFAIPGILMLLATLIFWSGRYQYVHIPAGGKKFVKETLSREGLRALGKLSIIYIFVAVFWALFDQTASAWVFQAQHMERMIFGIEILPAQIQAANPLLVLILIPLFSYYIYPFINRFYPLNELRKIAIGLFLTVVAFVFPLMLQMSIDHGGTPHIGWQLFAYVILTSAEVMVAITCLEFSYTQAPRNMKSFIMAFFMLSVAAGNLFTSAVNFFIENEDGSSKLAGAHYYWFFTLVMLGTAILFTLVVRFYKKQTYIHEELPQALTGRD